MWELKSQKNIKAVNKKFKKTQNCNLTYYKQRYCGVVFSFALCALKKSSVLCFTQIIKKINITNYINTIVGKKLDTRKIYIYIYMYVCMRVQKNEVEC